MHCFLPIKTRWECFVRTMSGRNTPNVSCTNNLNLQGRFSIRPHEFYLLLLGPTRPVCRPPTTENNNLSNALFFFRKRRVGSVSYGLCPVEILPTCPAQTTTNYEASSIFAPYETNGAGLTRPRAIKPCAEKNWLPGNPGGCRLNDS